MFTNSAATSGESSFFLTSPLSEEGNDMPPEGSVASPGEKKLFTGGALGETEELARLRPSMTPTVSRADARDEVPPTGYEDARPCIEGDGTCEVVADPMLPDPRVLGAEWIVMTLSVDWTIAKGSMGDGKSGMKLGAGSLTGSRALAGK